MITVIYSDTEGWNTLKQVKTVEEGVEYLLEEGIDVYDPEPCRKEGWNPSPTMIIGDDHEVKTFVDFQY